ncbi:hypothetical protein I4F81_005167 [Pyropia yezoensis]|uniref:Uncharacterized protein n=1 Tax=Pyropia yezoensis TaxID=2788 RepID=A0ACC3BY18_PYRYE|nr:hypothetical protein I4F81_005167 [Neopyropia yezoensis]
MARQPDCLVALLLPVLVLAVLLLWVVPVAVLERRTASPGPPVPSAGDNGRAPPRTGADGLLAAASASPPPSGGGGDTPPPPVPDRPDAAWPSTPDRDAGGRGFPLATAASAPPARWEDVTEGSGLPTGRGLKFGGPSLGDFDGDGRLDAALLNHHTTRTWAVHGAPPTADARIRFSRAADVYPGESSYLSDVHGIAVGDVRGSDAVAEEVPGGNGTAAAGLPSLLVARGGWNGHKPAVPWLLHPTADAPAAAAAAADAVSVGGGWTDAADPAGLAAVGARGRSPRLVDLDADGDLDALLVNYAGKRRTLDAASGTLDDVQLVYENTGSGGYQRVSPKHPPDARRRQVHWATAPAEAVVFTALGGADTPPWVWRDARRRARGEDASAAGAPWTPSVTFVSYPWLSFWTVHNWTFTDVTDQVLAGVPGGRTRLSPAAGVAEVDVDGDGLRDLVVTRFGPGQTDILLRAAPNGTYTDVSALYLPEGFGGHRGVVAGDFNLDGFEDLFLSSKTAGQPDTLLTSAGAGVPYRVSVGGHGAVPAGRAATIGDAAAAADFDGDGILDLLVGDGDQDLPELSGSWSLFAGTPPEQSASAAHWLQVVVGTPPVGPLAPPTGARISVECGGRLWTRRIGGGGPVFSQSLDPTAHVGLGGCDDAAGVRVGVVWSTGAAAVSVGRVPVDTVVRVGGGAGGKGTQLRVDAWVERAAV